MKKTYEEYVACWAKGVEMHRVCRLRQYGIGQKVQQRH